MQVPEDVRAALEAYRENPSEANWTTLSQLSVGDQTVFGAVKQAYPDFPDPLPLPVEDLAEDNEDFFAWERLPRVDEIVRALISVPE